MRAPTRVHSWLLVGGSQEHSYRMNCVCMLFRIVKPFTVMAGEFTRQKVSTQHKPVVDRTVGLLIDGFDPDYRVLAVLPCEVDLRVGDVDPNGVEAVLDRGDVLAARLQVVGPLRVGDPEP